jgi:hypothetical protein
MINKCFILEILIKKIALNFHLNEYIYIIIFFEHITQIYLFFKYILIYINIIQTVFTPFTISST